MPTRPPRDSVESAVDVLTDRWTFLIMREAFFGVRRYGQMQRNLGIARNVLAQRLRRLVANGMLKRVWYSKSSGPKKNVSAGNYKPRKSNVAARPRSRSSCAGSNWRRHGNACRRP